MPGGLSYCDTDFVSVSELNKVSGAVQKMTISARAWVWKAAVEPPDPLASRLDVPIQAAPAAQAKVTQRGRRSTGACERRGIRERRQACAPSWLYVR